jgi:hypothetical protein
VLAEKCYWIPFNRLLSKVRLRSELLCVGNRDLKTPVRAMYVSMTNEKVVAIVKQFLYIDTTRKDDHSYEGPFM